MRRLVLDNNQVSDFARRMKELPAGVTGITLNPEVCAEILLGPQPDRFLASLHRYPVRVGLETGLALDRASALGIGELRNFTPWDAAQDEMFRTLPSAPPEARRAAAIGIKDRNRRFCTWMREQSSSLRKEASEGRHPALPKCSDSVEVTQAMCQPDRIEWLIVVAFSNGGKRATSIKDETELVLEVLRCRHLSRLFAMQMFYMLSVTRIWTDQTLNIQSPDDYWPDITNSFYADDSDIIVTRDAWHRRAVEIVETALGLGDPVRTMSVAELLGESGAGHLNDAT